MKKKKNGRQYNESQMEIFRTKSNFNKRFFHWGERDGWQGSGVG